MQRRIFLQGLVGAGFSGGLSLHAHRSAADSSPATVSLPEVLAGEDIFGFLRRTEGAFKSRRFKQILGAANEFKEGDQIVGVAAADEASRRRARQLLAQTRRKDLDAHPIHVDRLYRLIEGQRGVGGQEGAGGQENGSQPADGQGETGQGQTIGQLKQWLLDADEASIRAIMPSLSSQTIGCVVKLMSNAELIRVGARIFNPLPGSQIGAKGYLGARIQPNSPTDNVDDIRWQVLDGWSYAVGDVLLGTNPVSSEPHRVAAIQATLSDLLETFGISQFMPHCVLAHIDVQAEVEREDPGTTALWFQSIAGTDAANKTFDVSVDKMMRYASQRRGPYGLYFETGQGADFTNGHGHGFDMVLHESRKYGFARVLREAVGQARAAGGGSPEPWVHLNDVAGFIGPEVFRTRQQLVRCCLEDIVMGKLHGLCLGLDVCSTLHMDISLEDLDWCLDQILPANPAYLMALPTKIDPMLGYLTTSFQDHVRLRQKFSMRVNPPMWQFFQRLGVIDQQGRPTSHFGDPVWVYQQYCRAKSDVRNDAEIRAEAERQLAEVRGRGVFVARGHGGRPWQLQPKLQQQVSGIYASAKKSIWAELQDDFVASLPHVLRLETQSADRSDYILHPETGEKLNTQSQHWLEQLRQAHAGQFHVQVVVSDGLNALAIMHQHHLGPLLKRLHSQLQAARFRPAPEHLVVTSGRVRAGYRIGETLFANAQGRRAILHVIGERPGTGHDTFSIYITATTGADWSERGKVDHNITKVVSGVASTALAPVDAADDTMRILKPLMLAAK